MRTQEQYITVNKLTYAENQNPIPVVMQDLERFWIYHSNKPFIAIKDEFF